MSSAAADRLQKQVLENATSVERLSQVHLTSIGGNETDRLGPRIAARAGGVKLLPVLPIDQPLTWF